MEFSIISPCFGKGQFFSDNPNLTNLVDIQYQQENCKWIMFPTEFVVCLKNVLVIPHGFKNISFAAE